MKLFKRKYRIVKVSNNYYIVLERIFGIWFRLGESRYYYNSEAGGYEKYTEYFLYDTVKEAEETIQRDNEFPIKYRNHKIDIGRDRNNNFIYVDLNSSFYSQNSIHRPYRRGCRSLEDVKTHIDKEEDSKNISFEVVKEITI